MKILIAGIGNIFFGDDAFGCEVVKALQQRDLPKGVKVRDFGIRGLDLCYALLDEYELVIVVDAIQRHGFPGTLYLIEPQLTTNTELEEPLLEGHTMTPDAVLRTVRALGGQLSRVRILGCEPATNDPEFGSGSGLSAPVRAAVFEAIRIIETLIGEVRGQRSSAAVEASFSV